VRRDRGRESGVQAGTIDSDARSQAASDPPMSKLTQTQTGAFFGILASVLIFVLTAMALASMNSLPRHHSHISTAALTEDNQAPTGLIG